MDKRYVSLSVVRGKGMNDETVPLEVAVLILDEKMTPIDDYSTPVVPSQQYDSSMIAMHTPAHLVTALDNEGLWSVMGVSAIPAEAADRYVADKIERHCNPETSQVVVLCDLLGPTRDATFRFLPITAKKLERRNASWLEIEPLKGFVEGERIYGETQWKHRAKARARSVANYALQMRRTMRAGADAIGTR